MTPSPSPSPAGQQSCARCGAALAPPSGPTWACQHCHAQYEAPKLPHGYIWLSNETILSLMREHLIGVDSTHLHPSIPPKKVANVRKVHAAHLPPDEPIIGLYDGTAFGSANDGWIVTANRFCFKNQMQAATCVGWKEIPEHEVYADGNRLRIGRAELDTLFGKNDDGLYGWEEVIRTIARSARGPVADEVAEASAGAAAAVAHAQAWGGPEVLVAAAGGGWGGMNAAHAMGAGIAVDAPRPDVEPFAQTQYATEVGPNVVDVHPSGEILLAAGDAIIELRHSNGGQRYLAFPAPSSVLCARFSPDGNWLLVGGTDQRAALFEVRTGQHRGVSPRLDDSIDEVAWLGNGTSFAMASQRGEVVIVDGASMTVTGRILGPDPEYGHLGGLAVSPDGTCIYVCVGRRLGAFDVASGAIRWRAEEVLYNGGRLALSPDGATLVMAGYDGVALLGAATGALRMRYQFRCAAGVSWPEPGGGGGLLGKLTGDEDYGPRHTSWSPRPRFSPSGEAIAVQDHVGSLCFIETSTGALHHTGRALGRAWIEDLAWFADSNHILLGCSDNSIAIWRARPLEGVMRAVGIMELPPEAYERATYLVRDDYDDAADFDDY